MDNKKICIIDYNSGNTGSVFNILKFLNYNLVLSNKDHDIIDSTHLILPGVGSFKSVMQNIQHSVNINLIKDLVVKKKKPILGICVGMQIFASKGFEFSEYQGLNFIPGVVKKIDTDLSIPHIGWNNITINNKSNLIHNVDNDDDFYFLHSYKFNADNDKNIVSYSSYGEKFCSIIQKENIYGVQFHPEKSQLAGQKILKNFIEFN